MKIVLRMKASTELDGYNDGAVMTETERLLSSGTTIAHVALRPKLGRINGHINDLFSA